MIRYVGIDPGLKGGVSIINNDKELYANEMFLTKDKELDVYEIYHFLKYDDAELYCVIEKSQAMPGQGVTGMFNYGKGYGKLLAILDILQINYLEVRPTQWKKYFKLLKTDKNKSVELAERLFPDTVFRTKRGRLMDGKAESALMAEYCRREKDVTLDFSNCNA